MKSLQLTGIRRMDIRELPAPVIQKPEDVLVRMEAIGICGSDLHYFTHGGIGRNRIEFPFTIGHEGAGKIEAVGTAVTEVKPGDRIAVEPAISCGHCDLCQEDRENLCRNLTFISAPGQASGCLSEFIVMPARNCVPVPASFSPEMTALLEPLAIGVYAARCAAPVAGQSVLILGAGPIGLSVLVALQEAGAGPCVVSDPVPERRELALKLGAAHVMAPSRTPNGDLRQATLAHEIKDVLGTEPHIAFECCGEQEALDDAILALRPGGRLFILGIPMAARISFDTDWLRRKEIPVHYVRRQCGSLNAAIALATGRIEALQRMITHRFPLEDGGRGFAMLEHYQDGIIKGMIMPYGWKRKGDT